MIINLFNDDGTFEEAIEAVWRKGNATDREIASSPVKDARFSAKLNKELEAFIIEQDSLESKFNLDEVKMLDELFGGDLLIPASQIQY